MSIFFKNPSLPPMQIVTHLKFGKDDDDNTATYENTENKVEGNYMVTYQVTQIYRRNPDGSLTLLKTNSKELKSRKINDVPLSKKKKHK